MLRSAASKVMWAGSARMFALLLAVMVALVLGYATKAYAAPGHPDPSFDTDGKANTEFVYEYKGLALALQEDGKAVVAGHAYNASTSSYEFALARYNPNGTLDASFGGDGIVTTPVGSGNSYDVVEAVAVRADGKIVVAGRTYNSTTGSDFALARYNPDGTLDPSFGGDGIVTTSISAGTSWDDDHAYGLAVQGNKALVAGVTYNGDPATGGAGLDFALVRYNDNGNLDTTFGSGGVVKTDFSGYGSNDAASGIAVQEDGNIVVAGTNGGDFAIARYNTSGALDTSFDSDGKTTTDFFGGSDAAEDVAVQEDGRIVAAGYTASNSNYDFAIARYKAGGSLDVEFDFDGRAKVDFGSTDLAYGLALQDGGRTVLAGRNGSDFVLARLNDDGSPNASFHNDGKLNTDFFGGSDVANGVAVQEDGKIVAAGSAQNGSNADFAIARYYGGNDATPPNVKPPVQSLIRGSTLGKSATPIKLNWSATDLHGEVTGYQLQQRKDSSSYTNVKLPSATATTVNRPGVFGSSYRFRVRATDDNGNTSFWKYGPNFSVDLHQETDSAVTYSGTWKNQSMTSASGGALKFSTAKDSTAKLTFNGRNVAWVAPKASNRGRAEVYLDGKKVATVDLYSSKVLPRKVIYSASGLDPSVAHTLEVKVLGTKRAVSKGVRVDVDAFVVLR